MHTYAVHLHTQTHINTHTHKHYAYTYKHYAYTYIHANMQEHTWACAHTFKLMFLAIDQFIGLIVHDITCKTIFIDRRFITRGIYSYRKSTCHLYLYVSDCNLVIRTIAIGIFIIIMKPLKLRTV